jgi:hypothetical protein
MMLQDIERKLLRVLYNFSRMKHRMPMWVELEHKMGHNKPVIQDALRGLVEKQYIFYPDNPDLSTLVILKTEYQEDLPTKKSGTSSNIDYWTKY